MAEVTWLGRRHWMPWAMSVIPQPFPCATSEREEREGGRKRERKRERGRGQGRGRAAAERGKGIPLASVGRGSEKAGGIGGAEGDVVRRCEGGGQGVGNSGAGRRERERIRQGHRAEHGVEQRERE